MIWIALALAALLPVLISAFPWRALHPAPLSRQNTVDDVIRRFYHGAFLLDNALYVDGGECTTSDWQRGNQVYNYTLKIDLSSSFSTKDSSSTSVGSLIDKGDCPNFNIAAYWVDVVNNTAYTYGGEYSYLNPWIGAATVPPEALWAFSSQNGDSWHNIDQSYDSIFTTLTRPGYGGYAFGDGGGFYLGGKHGSRGSQKTNIGGYTAAPGMQFYNFSSGVQFVSGWGDTGLAIALGGQDFYTTQYFPWNNVGIFDPATQQWHSQITTGDVPDTRWEFCNVGMSNGTTNGTYEVFVYGGVTATATTDRDVAAEEGDALYVLSLPAFHWFRTNTTSGDPRHLHVCSTAGQRQMLSVGGINPSLNSTAVNNTNAQINATDPYIFGLKILDLTRLEWTDEYNPQAEAYTAPSVVQDYYAKQPRYPTRWSSDAVKDIFIRSPSSGNTTSGNSSAPAPTPTGSSTSSNTGAIAGGVVGGILGLSFILGCVWFFCLRPRSKQKKQQQQEREAAAAAAAAQASKEKVAKDATTVHVGGELESPPAPERQELGHGYFSGEGRRELPGGPHEEQAARRNNPVYEI